MMFEVIVGHAVRTLADVMDAAVTITVCPFRHGLGRDVASCAETAAVPVP
jgi:hypothetical protein